MSFRGSGAGAARTDACAPPRSPVRAQTAPRGILTDYDVALVAIPPESFDNDDWLGLVGQPLVRVRDVDAVDGIPVHHRMAIFDDWAKIDFSFWPATLPDFIGDAGRRPDEFAAGYRVLLDKDGLTAGGPQHPESRWITARPSAQEFDDLVQELGFVATDVARYLWRNEPLAAKVIFDHELKPLVVRRMLDWRGGLQNDWAVPSGFFGRVLQHQLDPATWDAFMATYVGADPAANRAALFPSPACSVGSPPSWRPNSVSPTRRGSTTG